MPVLTAPSTCPTHGLTTARHQEAIDSTAVEATLADLPLRPDQKDAVRAFFAGLADRSRVGTVEMPTGTGKTRVGVAVALCLAAAGYNVLWACKRWKLLRQAAATFADLAPNQERRLHRLGGKRELSLSPLPSRNCGRVIFTTLQTWYGRRESLPKAIAPSGRLAVVWDEMHWGFASTIGRTFRKTYAKRVPVLGLSATPPASGGNEVIYRKSPDDYFGTVLATSTFERLQTDVTWTPEVVGDDFTPRSLRVLAGSRPRNAKIVDTVVRLRAEGRARCMIVFAADIPHATELARLLSEAGVPARAVHSKQSFAAQDEAEALFKGGKLDVLVNVDQLTEGFDHPPIDAVLLTRPTRSRRRWVQMVGRGARKAPGKDTFLVVDFADNVTRFGEGVVRAGTVFPSLASVKKNRSYAPPARYTEPPDVPKFENYVIPEYGTIPIALWQTFGVEIELTSAAGVPALGPEWEAVALKILARLKQHVGLPVHPEPLVCKGGPLTAWRVTYDSSAGWEVVSPILVNAAGLDELRRACEAIAAVVDESGDEIRVNHRTGLHLTLATSLNTEERLRGFVKLVQRLEPGLFTLVAPSRLYPVNPKTGRYSRRAGNRYCRPLRGIGDPDRVDLDVFVGDYDNRYRTVNLTKSKDDVPLLEVRMHNGTHEFRKIVLWVSLWMQLFNAARYRRVTGHARPGLVLPGRNRSIALAAAAREDIVALLKAEGVPLTPEFVRLLKDRRRELRSAWEKVLPNRVARWAAAGWYDRPTPLARGRIC